MKTERYTSQSCAICETSNCTHSATIRTFESVISRQAALTANLPHYFTGQPCKQGHIAKRFTNSRQCLACNAAKSAKHRTLYPERIKQRNDDNYGRNRETRKAAQREWNERNAEHAAAYAAQYRAQHPGAAQEWRQKNKRRVVLYATRRRAAKLQRTPKWADLAAIDAFYLACPEGYEVDHIIPLRGRLVSGLHVFNNLQYLKRSENARKRNKFNPWTFEA